MIGGRARRGVAVLLAALVLAGCAGLPQDGTVQRVEVEQERAGSTARYEPEPPVPGASPQQVVRGYLDAMLAYPVSRTVAVQFLAPQAATTWQPSNGMEIYSEPRVVADPQRPRAVGFERLVEAELDAQGRRSPRGEQALDDLEVVQVAGEWRIANPPPGLLVTEQFAEDYVRPFSIYFFDEQLDALIPDLVHLVVGETLPTALVSSLARGPEPGGSRRTFVPEVADLRPSVPIGPDGVAEVEFTAGMEEQLPVDQQRASAQVVWTLRQVEQITAVRFLGATALRAPGGDTTQPIDSWGRYEASEVTAGPWVLADGRLREVDELTLGSPRGDVLSPDPLVVAVRDSTVASVGAQRPELLIAGPGDRSSTTIPVQEVVDLSWGPDGDLVVLESLGGERRLRTWRAGELTDVDAGLLGDARLLRLSPEGGRYVALVGESLAVGDVVRDTGGRVIALGEPRVVEVDLEAVGSPVWSSSTRISFLAETERGRQVHSVQVDGSDLRGGQRGGTALLPDVDATVLVSRVADGRDWVLDARGRVWTRTSSDTWTRVRAGAISFLAPPG